MKLRYYILNEKKQVVPTEDVLVWAEFFENYEGRIVKQDKLKPHRVSTVFVGMGHNPATDKPQLFETVVFDKEEGIEVVGAYSTWFDALEGHNRIVDKFDAGEFMVLWEL